MASASIDGPVICPLCGSVADAPWQASTGAYRHCTDCDLVFREPSTWLAPDAERAYYGTHENRVDDPGYRRFLAQLAEPLVQRLSAGAHGLDYGCGAAPALAAMLGEAGFPTRGYDPFFMPDTGQCDGRYDFVTCTEVLEHLHHPLRELARMDGLLKSGGWLGLMTELRPPMDGFARWHYHRDPTHVLFFSEASLRWIAAHFRWRIEAIDRRVMLLHKPAVEAQSSSL